MNKISITERMEPDVGELIIEKEKEKKSYNKKNIISD